MITNVNWHCNVKCITTVNFSWLLRYFQLHTRNLGKTFLTAIYFFVIIYHNWYRDLLSRNEPWGQEVQHLSLINVSSLRIMFISLSVPFLRLENRCVYLPPSPKKLYTLYTTLFLWDRNSINIMIGIKNTGCTFCFAVAPGLHSNSTVRLMIAQNSWPCWLELMKVEVQNYWKVYSYSKLKFWGSLFSNDITYGLRLMNKMYISSFKYGVRWQPIVSCYLIYFWSIF